MKLPNGRETDPRMVSDDLMAELVSKLSLTVGPDGVEHWIWMEVDPPSMSELAVLAQVQIVPEVLE